jgi:hypothetical protein
MDLSVAHDAVRELPVPFSRVRTENPIVHTVSSASKLPAWQASTVSAVPIMSRDD